MEYIAVMTILYFGVGLSQTFGFIMCNDKPFGMKNILFVLFLWPYLFYMLLVCHEIREVNDTNTAMRIIINRFWNGE